MVVVVLWSEQGNGQGQGRCKHALIFGEPVVSFALFWNYVALWFHVLSDLL